jgi:hypothetical protein
MSLAFEACRAQIETMASNLSTLTRKKSKAKAIVLGRSAATGRFVLAPATTKKKSKVSNKRLDVAVKTALSRTK